MTARSSPTDSTMVLIADRSSRNDANVVDRTGGTPSSAPPKDAIYRTECRRCCHSKKEDSRTWLQHNIRTRPPIHRFRTNDGCASCYAGPITYTGSVTGPNDTAFYTITTDGNVTTPLDNSDITSVSFYQTGSNPFGPTAPFDFSVNGADLTATPTELLFNFGGTDRGSFIMNDSGRDVLALLTPYVFGSPPPLEQTVFEPVSGPFQFFFQNSPSPGETIIGTSTPEPGTLATMLGEAILLGFAASKRRTRILHQAQQSRLD